MSERPNTRWEDFLSNPVRPAFDVFLSHSHGEGGANHTRVIHICRRLQREFGIRPWLDEDQIHVGDVLLERLTDGVEQSTIFLVFVTQDYIDKANGRGPNGLADNVRHEFNAAYQGNKIMIPIVMESGIEWSGHVGTILFPLLRVYFTTPTEINENFGRLTDSLRYKLPPNSFNGEEDPTSVNTVSPSRNFIQTVRNIISFGGHNQRGESFSFDEPMDTDQLDLDQIDDTLAPFNV